MKTGYYHYTTAEVAIKILESRQVKFSRISQLNDPFDARLRVSLTDNFQLKSFINLLKKEFNESHYFSKIYSESLYSYTKIENLSDNKNSLYVHNLQEVINKIFIHRIQPITEKHDRIFCCSILPNIPSLWSHYSDNYKGVVIEFHDPFKKNEGLFAESSALYQGNPITTSWRQDVKYSLKDPACFNEKKMITWLKEMAQTLKTGNSQWTHEKIVIPCYFGKSKYWDYEKEYRFLRFLPNGHPQINCTHHFENILTKNIKSIILGYLIEPWYEEYIKKIIISDYKDMQIKKIEGFGNKYSFLYKEIYNC